MKAISKDATKKKATQLDVNAAFLSKLREEKHASNQKRANAAKSQKMGSVPKSFKKDKNKKRFSQKTMTNPTACGVHKKYFVGLQPYLESLPDPKPLPLSKELASIILSTAINRRQKQEALSYLTSSSKTPNLQGLDSA